LQVNAAARQAAQTRFTACCVMSTSLDSLDFKTLPSLNKVLVLELARSEFVIQRENIMASGPSGTGKTHLAIGLGLAACQRGMTVGFVTAAGLVNQLVEARDDSCVCNHPSPSWSS
jgi:DNA replication protein DnaC